MLSTGVIALLVGLAESLAALFCGIAAYCWVRRGPLDRTNHWKLTAEALILGLTAGYGLVAAASPAPGLFFDARFVLITLATLFSGPVVGALTTLTICAVRLWIGGIGVVPGLVTSIAVFAAAELCRRWFARRGRTPTQRDLFVVSMLVSAVSMLGLAFIPVGPETMLIAGRAAAALFLINPVGLFVLSSLVLWDERTKQLQIDRANANARFLAVIDNLPVSLVLYDQNKRVTQLNRRYEELYGPEIKRFIGRDVAELRAHLLPESLDHEIRIAENQKSDPAAPLSFYFRDTSIMGTERSVLLTRFSIPDAAGNLGGGGGGTIGVDVSELRRSQREAETLQAQLIQASKMEAIGQLAGGIAHDFNNLLGAIIGYASFLNEDLPKGEESHGYVVKILKICDRAKSLVEQVLAFARADRVERRRIDLKAVIAETRELMRPLLPPTTEVTCDLGAGPLWMEANEGQISQIILNLCVNASDALGGEVGHVAVSLTRAPATSPEASACLTEAPCRQCGGVLTAGREYIRLVVCDDGPGMTPETLKRIMEPFFTTKGRSEGTGLGLPLVHAIVISYGGAYVFESKPGAGTCVTIFLPYDASANEARRDPDKPAERASRGKERILIVDDESDIRDVYLIGLERLGFEVACCADPIEALEIFAEDPDVWDVVVSDEVMPNIGGAEMLRRMRALRPSIRTILCSGFGELVSNAPPSLDHVDRALAKPIEPKKLAEHIRQLVDR